MSSHLVSLPPKVNGNKTGYLTIHLLNIDCKSTFVFPLEFKILWWGQTKQDFAFKVGTKNDNKKIRYCIKTTYSLFKNYLNNSNVLILNVLKNQQKIGYCAINDLTLKLTNNSIFKNVYNVFNDNNRTVFKITLEFDLNINDCLIENQKRFLPIEQNLSTKTKNELDNQIVDKKLKEKLFNFGDHLRKSIVQTVIDNNPLDREICSNRSNQYYFDTNSSNKLNVYFDELNLVNNSSLNNKFNVSNEFLNSSSNNLDELVSMRCSSSNNKINTILKNECILKNSSQNNKRPIKNELISSKNKKHLINNETFEINRSNCKLKIVIDCVKLNDNGRSLLFGKLDSSFIKSPTFFIEYQLPEILTRKQLFRGNRREHLTNDNIVRFCSRRSSDKVILFEKQSIKEIENLERINLNYLEIDFKFYCRLISERTAKQFGFAKFNSFKQIIQSSKFNQPIDILSLSDNTQIGQLNLCLCLNNFAQQSIDSVFNSKEEKKKSNKLSGNKENQLGGANQANQINEFEKINSNIALHFLKDNCHLNCLFYISDINFDANVVSSNQIYFQARCFWWPQTYCSRLFNFVEQIITEFLKVNTIQLNAEFLKKLRNNFIVLEFWQIDHFNDDDILIGIVKISLQHFYQILNQNQINYLINKKFPILSNSDSCAIINPINNTKVGGVNYLLAFGTEAQLKFLQTTNNIKQTVVSDNLSTKLRVDATKQDFGVQVNVKESKSVQTDDWLLMMAANNDNLNNINDNIETLKLTEDDSNNQRNDNNNPVLFQRYEKLMNLIDQMPPMKPSNKSDSMENRDVLCQTSKLLDTLEQALLTAPNSAQTIKNELTTTTMTTQINLSGENCTTSSLINNAFKRKLNELNDISKRLKHRLTEVIPDHWDDDLNDSEFEHDINTECKSESEDDEFFKRQMAVHLRNEDCEKANDIIRDGNNLENNFNDLVSKNEEIDLKIQQSNFQSTS